MKTLENTPALIQGMRTNRITSAGKERFASELHTLQNEVLKEASLRLGILMNEDYEPEDPLIQSTRLEIAAIEARIRRLKYLLATSSVVEVGSTPERIDIGSEVIIQEKGKTPVTYKIVSSAEAYSSALFVSDQSPLGRALIGCSEGDSVTVNAPAGTWTATILSVA